jgi:Insertion element 4 transposase N-terminal
MNLFAHLSIAHVMRKLARGLRFIWPDPSYRLPQASALTYRRYQLGARPLAALFRRLCRPMATPQTPGAFRFGLRLMAIDGTVEGHPRTLRSAHRP